VFNSGEFTLKGQKTGFWLSGSYSQQVDKNVSKKLAPARLCFPG
jgi:hypothetical protein